WSTFSAQGNKICWAAKVQLSPKAAEEESFRNSEWGPEANEAFIKEVYNFNTPHGKLGEFIDQTPSDCISRVFLEDKLFETWHHRRTVLIGDGAITAMQDAVVLANCIYEMTSVNIENVEAALAEFRLQRYEHVKIQHERSKTTAKTMYGMAWHERLLRNVVLSYLPRFMFEKGVTRDGAYRPQASFLPLAPPRGQGPFLQQKPSAKYLKLQVERAKAERVALEGDAAS
ncbi:hypothetical protein BGZ52_008111, partial [Haplosporangium bisporale]